MDDFVRVFSTLALTLGLGSALWLSLAASAARLAARRRAL